MARSFKDDSAFNNWERDIKKYNNNAQREEKETKESFSQWKCRVEAGIAKKLNLEPNSLRISGYMTRGKSILEPRYNTNTNVDTVAKELVRDFEPTNLGFSFAQANLWASKGTTLEQPNYDLKKPRKKKVKETLVEETPTDTDAIYIDGVKLIPVSRYLKEQEILQREEQETPKEDTSGDTEEQTK